MGSMQSHTSDPSHSGDILITPTGWPDLYSEQQACFQSWCLNRMAARRAVTVKTLEHLRDEALHAEAEGDMVKAISKLNQAGELQSAVDVPLTIEEMRMQAWLFLQGASS